MAFGLEPGTVLKLHRGNGQLQAFLPSWTLQVWPKALFSQGWSRLFGAACLMISRLRRPWKKGEMKFSGDSGQASARQSGVVERI